MLAYVRKHGLYHFVIDRFGRVFRVVAESDYANHAGFSVWADSTWIYINLNQSFLGVSFEAQTEPGLYAANPAQVHAAKILTQMLRSKYRIPESNCVTHAQVSVNPDTMQIGYHTDWAGNFPFRDLGLKDQYESPLPGVTLFGFGYDDTFLRAIGKRVWKGLLDSEKELLTSAAAQGLTVVAYRKQLQKKYRETLAALRRGAAPQEKTDDGS